MFILNHHQSIANQYLAELRDVTKQNDRLRFRRNLERLGEIMAYEISKEMDFQSSSIITPLEKTIVDLLSSQPVIIPILRAAIPFFQGMVNYFDQADCGFIGAYRKKPLEENSDVEIEFGYLAAPGIKGKEVILVDPMLATGKSFVESLNNLLKNGEPSRIHIVSVIAAPEGIQYIKDNLSVSHKFWLCALDEKLDEKYYILPGLGDAGDLAFGPKL
ncbi:MAG: uracil phosphoribosyltransferase [Anditalea sp.]